MKKATTIKTSLADLIMAVDSELRDLHFDTDGARDRLVSLLVTDILKSAGVRR